MKVMRERINRHGRREVTVELCAGEQLQAIQPHDFYRTGYPVEDVVQGNIILDCMRVTWCSLEQKWVS